MASIDHCLESIDDLERAILGALEIVKGGISLLDLPNLISVIKDLVDLAIGVREILPEASDIDAVEASILFNRAYSLVKKVISAI